MENKIPRTILKKMKTFILKSSKGSRGTFINNWKEVGRGTISKGMPRLSLPSKMTRVGIPALSLKCPVIKRHR